MGTYSPTKTAWYKVTVCTSTTVTTKWHNSGACSDTAATDQTTVYAAVATCMIGKTTGSSATHYSKITSISGVSDAKVCAFTAANNSGTANCNTAAAHSPTFATMDL